MVSYLKPNLVPAYIQSPQFNPSIYDEPEDVNKEESLYKQQNDPFYSECRAYGRLKETNNEKLAVKCYGYVIFNNVEEQTCLTKSKTSLKGSHSSTGHFDPLLLREEDDPRPIRALVKDLIEGVPSFTRSQVIGMIADVKKIHKIGICLGGDIRKDAYVGGKLVDFSRSQTVPHDYLDGIHRRRDNLNATTDVETFDDMIDEWNENHPEQYIWRRLAVNSDYVGKLRGARRIWDGSIDHLWDTKFNPADYDWKSIKREKSMRNTCRINKKGERMKVGT
ncbi:uncharacterized protein JN550_005434 [Neoarthrinium moseri]|uniref:uncharacterized protein n=1 Tax=Neoarthrinium moseri TaxID=1658444 RepID=UPI001FDB7F5E|nr:uncharacterized protein JN550_005434 [Neoarthrinium moseri]KAI1869844.1 hypothetical protein JN550_005434 [Neoarthrinium moseri]